MHTRSTLRAATAAEPHSLASSLAMAGVVIGRVINGQSLTRAMAELKATGALRSAVQSLSYSTLREYGRCDALLAALTRRPPAASLGGLLMAALTELRKNRQAPHAVVHQAVEAAAIVAPRNPAVAKGLVNAVLRQYLRQQDELLARIDATERGRYQHPDWWIARVRRDWPQHWERLLASGNEQPGMTLRVNIRRTDVATCMEKLEKAGIGAHALGAQGIRLDHPVVVERLPGFAQGEISVQDWGAQQAAALLGVHDGMRVLDACAAPGGKAAHVAETSNCELIAIDADPLRLKRVHENMHRLGLGARVLCADALAPDPALGLFDRILADVPCSASGVVRRHPDVKWLRRDSDIAAFAQTQRSMLDALWPLLKPGGRLLYATCSVFRQEDEEQVAGFLARHADASLLPLQPGSGNVQWDSPGQILPGPLSDGFYYALLGKGH